MAGSLGMAGRPRELRGDRQELQCLAQPSLPAEGCSVRPADPFGRALCLPRCIRVPSSQVSSSATTFSAAVPDLWQAIAFVFSSAPLSMGELDNIIG